MSKPNFKEIDIDAILTANQAVKEDKNFMTNEGIEIKSTYTEQDLDNLKHLKDWPGIAPNTRDHIQRCM